MKTQQQAIYDLITENTGTHILDSGGSSGRHWQRNRKHSLQDFIDSDEIVFRPRLSRDGKLDWDVTLSLFHFLDNNLDYDDDLTNLFNRFVDRRESEFWEFWEEHHQEYNPETQEYFDAGPRGYGDWSWEKAIGCFVGWAIKHSSKYHESYDFSGEKGSDYTYNQENILSQDFIYYYFGDVVFIRTHNGADARGGFTGPVIFRQKSMNEYSWLNFSSYTICCENGHWWDFNDGYEDTEQVICLGQSHDNKRKTAKAIDYDNTEPEVLESLDKSIEEFKAYVRWFENQPSLFGEKGTLPPMPSLNTDGVVLVRDGIAYCPICGSKLNASHY